MSLRTRVALLALLSFVVLVVVGVLVHAAYADVSTSTKAVQVAAPADRDLAIEGLAGVARRMAISLAVAGGVLFTLGVGSYLLVRRWVLAPLDRLGGQLREVARDGRRDQVIRSGGPPEIRAVAHDAEAMRRSLVVEADAAQAADEGLEQEGPVVAAIRRELDPDSDPVVEGLEIHGRLHPAQGVLAGDWWGTVALDHGRTALIVLDPGASTLHWANAGHPAGWLLPAGSTQGRILLEPTGPLLSTLGGSWEMRRAPLGLDDVLLAWSDGLVESRDARDEVTDDTLVALLGALEAREPRTLVPALLADLRADAPEWSRDDITLVAVRRTR